MLSDTTYLDCRPLLIYFLPQLPDFLTTNTFMSCRSWLTSSTLTPLIILYKTPSEAQVLKISVVFFQIVPLLYWIFMSNKSHSKLNISLTFRGGRIALNIIIFPSPEQARKRYKQRARFPLVLCVKPSNERFIIPLLFSVFSILTFSVRITSYGFICVSYPLHKICAKDGNNQN